MEDKRICTLVRELLPQYDANACSEEVRAEIHEHLRECDECDQAYADVHASAKELEIERFIKKRKKRKLLGGISLILVGIIVVGMSLQIYRNIPETEVYTSTENTQGYFIRRGDAEGQTVQVVYEVVWEKIQLHKKDDYEMRLRNMNFTVLDENKEILLNIRQAEDEMWFPSGQLEDGSICISLLSMSGSQKDDEFNSLIDYGNLYATENMESFILSKPEEYILSCPSTEDWQAYDAVKDFVKLFNLYPLIVSPSGSSIYDAMLNWNGGMLNGTP